MYIAGNEAYPPFANAGVRQALKWAIDYDGIQKNITPNTNTVNQAFEPSMMLGAVNTNPFKKDPTERRSCLRKPDIRRASVLHSIISLGTRLPISPAAVQADLGAVGIKVSLLPGTAKQVVTKNRARQHQLVLNNWFPDYFDPNSNAQAFCSNPDDSDKSPLKIIAWRNHFHDPELTVEVAAAAAELDAQKRVELYHKMQKEFWDRSPIVFMLQQNNVAVARRNVSGSCSAYSRISFAITRHRKA